MCKFVIVVLIVLLLISVYIFKFNKKYSDPQKRWCAVDDNNITIMETEEKSSFYIHLLSNVATIESHRTNSVSNFVTKLAEKMTFDNEWLVGLSEISYTKSWYNIRKNQFVALFVSMPGASYVPGDDECYLKAGYYANIHNLIEELNKELLCLQKLNFEKIIRQPPQLSYDPITNRTHITAGITADGQYFVYPKLSQELQQILGMSFESNENYIDFFYSDGKFLADDKIKLKKHVNHTKKYDSGRFMVEIESKYPVQFAVCDMHLLVYCSIIQPVLVGDAFMILLRQVEIPRQVNFGEQCVVRYLDPFYYPLISQEIDSIEIDIRDDTGQRVPFEFGRCSMTLQFKKKSTDESKFIRKLLY